jgi:hypothetical protein
MELYRTIRTYRKGKETTGIKRYNAVKIERQGRVIICGLGDFVHLESGLEDRIPFVARISDLWEDTVHMTKHAQAQWLYRPSDLSKPPEDTKDNELFLTTHNDSNRVEVILETVRCRLIDSSGISTISSLFQDDYQGKYAATSNALQPVYEIRRAFDHVTQGLARLTAAQVAALRIYSEEKVGILADIYIPNHKGKKMKSSSIDDKSQPEDFGEKELTRNRGSTSSRKNSLPEEVSDKNKLSATDSTYILGNTATVEERSSSNITDAIQASESSNTANKSGKGKISDIEQLGAKNRNESIVASTSVRAQSRNPALHADTFNIKEEPVAPAEANASKKDAAKRQQQAQKQPQVTNDKTVKNQISEPKSDFPIPIGSGYQAAIPALQQSRLRKPSMSRDTTIWSTQNGVTASEIPRELQNVVTKSRLYVGKVVVVNVATSTSERRCMVSRVVQLPDDDQWLFVIPYDLAWPKFPDNPGSVNVPTLEFIFRVHFRSLVWVENYLELAICNLQARSEGEEETKRSGLQTVINQLANRKAGVDCLEIWTETEMVKLWSLLYKSGDQTSMTELAKAIGSDKTAKDIAQFICVVAYGVVRATSGAFPCISCKKQDIQHACKFFFKCRNGFCTDCFTSSPKRGLRFIGVPPVSKGTSNKSGLLLDDEMFWLCDSCVDGIPPNLTPARVTSSVSTRRSDMTGGNNTNKHNNMKAAQGAAAKPVTIPIEQVFPPTRMIQYRDGYDPNISWTNKATALGKGSCLFDGIQVLDEILYLLPRNTYDKLINSLLERDRLSISRRQLTSVLQSLQLSSDIVEADSLNSLKKFLPK